MPHNSDPSLFFGDSRWQNRFEDGILAAAQSLVSKARDLRLDETAAGSFTLLGNVASEETEAGFWKSDSGWDFET